MRYKIYLYKTADTDMIDGRKELIGRTISESSKSERRRYSAQSGMIGFDAQKVREAILARLTSNGKSLCKSEVCYAPENQAEYVYVVTSYENALRVLHELRSVADEYDLLLYDAEIESIVYKIDQNCKNYIAMMLSARRLNDLIFKTQKPIWSLRRAVVITGNGGKNSCSYVLTLRKDHSAFEDRVARFYELLRSNLAEGEELKSGCKCFAVCADGYEILYCVEGYKKSADKIGYTENGQLVTELIKRMPYDLAEKQRAALKEDERHAVDARMKEAEWIAKYPNPAERFVASVNLAKELCRNARRVERKIKLIGEDL